MSFARKTFAERKSLKNIGMYDEAVCRIGISRAYYAAFHKAENFLYEIEKDFQPKSGEGPHDRIINAFKRMSNLYHRKISAKLGDMKDLRERADYHSNRYKKRGLDGNVIGELQKAISYAESVNTVIDKCQQPKS